ncbi:uncharacterized protein VTP21DRAFT_7533 [Calcarisporiella thermophila]|uniref:uncharacterized protein n=1 Tax=Calcarisporiella thermophila TaxID=911321 RepID=UPI003743E1F5
MATTAVRVCGKIAEGLRLIGRACVPIRLADLSRSTASAALQNRRPTLVAPRFGMRPRPVLLSSNHKDGGSEPRTLALGWQYCRAIQLSVAASRLRFNFPIQGGGRGLRSKGDSIPMKIFSSELRRIFSRGQIGARIAPTLPPRLSHRGASCHGNPRGQSHAASSRRLGAGPPASAPCAPYAAVNGSVGGGAAFSHAEPIQTRRAKEPPPAWLAALGSCGIKELASGATRHSKSNSKQASSRAVGQLATATLVVSLHSLTAGKQGRRGLEACVESRRWTARSGRFDYGAESDRMERRYIGLNQSLLPDGTIPNGTRIYPSSSWAT